MRLGFMTVAGAGIGLLSLIASADARMGGGFGGHVGGFGAHMGGFGGHVGGFGAPMGGFGPRVNMGAAGIGMRGPSFAGGFGRAAFAGMRPMGRRFVGHPFSQHAFFPRRRFVRNRFAFAAFPFVSYATAYDDDGCWARVWTPYGLVWRNYCGYDY